VAKVLYINSDGASAGRLADTLDGREFSVRIVSHLADVSRAMDDIGPDLVVLSCSRPNGQIISFCAGLRQVSPVPIVVCSPSSRESDIVRVFESGADDYLVTPVRPVELTARLRAVLRRTAEAPEKQLQNEVVTAGDVEIRLKEHKAFRRGDPIELSPIEFRLLATLVQEVGRAVSHTRLIAHVWGPEYVDCRHYLRLYVKYLRSKIEDNPRDPKLILSEWGVGYRFEPAHS